MVKKISLLGIVLVLGLIVSPNKVKAVAPSDAVAYWKFDEGSGNVAYDASGNGNQGMITGGSWRDGRFGNALYFDGNDGMVYIDDANLSNPTFDNPVYVRTGEFWYKSEKLPNTNEIQIIYEEGGTTNGLNVYLKGSNVGVGAWSLSNGWNGAWLSVPTTADKWHHVVYVFNYNGVTGVFQLYYDGQFISEADVPTYVAYHGADDALCALAYDTRVEGVDIIVPTRDLFFNGFMDEVAIYDRALDLTEINARYRTMLQSIKANNASGGGYGIQANDQVVITFLSETKGNEINAENIDTALNLNNGHSWKDGSGEIGSAVWSDSIYPKDTLTITFSTAGALPSVVVEDIITLDGTIRDKDDTAITDSMAIGGSFDPVPADAVAYWRFDEGSGDIAYDSTGNGNDGIIHDAEGWIDGISGSALYFDGTGGLVSIDDEFNVNPTFDEAIGVRTGEFWYNADEVTGTQVIYEEGGIANGLNVYIKNSQVWVGAWSRSDFFWAGAWLSTDTTAGEWHQVVYVFNYDETTGTGVFQLYHDGEFIKEVSVPTYIAAHSADDALFGMSQDTSIEGIGYSWYGLFFGGSIDEVVIYDRALTGNDINGRYELFSYPVDTVSPSTSATLTGDEGNAGWHTSNVIVHLLATDAESGVKEIHYSVNGVDPVVSADTVSISLTAEGINIIDFYAVDNSGNIEGSQNLTVNIDKTPPSSLIADITGSMGDNGWYVSNVTVDLSASDAVSGIGVISYSVNGGPEVAQAQLSLTTEGQHTITYTAVDIAGNDVSGTLDVDIDKTAPETTIVDITGVMGNNGWYTSDVTVDFSASDAVSGIGYIRYSVNGGSEVVISGDQAQLSLTTDRVHTIEYYAVNNAGIHETTKTLEVKIDSTPPEVDAGDDVTFIQSEIVILPIPEVTDNLDPDPEWYNDAPDQFSGTTTVTVTATDEAGNESHDTITVTIITINDALEALKEKIYNLGSINFKNNAIQRKNALSHKIDAVEALVEAAGAAIEPGARDELFAEAMDKLQNDIRSKMNGCFDDSYNNDWIYYNSNDEISDSCDVQQELNYLINKIADILTYLRNA